MTITAYITRSLGTLETAPRQKIAASIAGPDRGHGMIPSIFRFRINQGINIIVLTVGPLRRWPRKPRNRKPGTQARSEIRPDSELGIIRIRDINSAGINQRIKFQHKRGMIPSIYIIISRANHPVFRHDERKIFRRADSNTTSCKSASKFVVKSHPFSCWEGSMGNNGLIKSTLRTAPTSDTGGMGIIMPPSA